MILCKNVVVNGRRTSMRLEKEIWNGLSEKCRKENISLSKLCSLIEQSKHEGGLSAAVRLCAFNYYRNLLSQYETLD